MIGSWLGFLIFKKIMLGDVLQNREFVFTENPLFYETSFLKKIPTAIYILGYYLKLMAIPYPLSSYYGFNAVPIAGWNNFWVYVSMSIHLALGFFAIKGLLKKNIYSFALLFYFISIFPYSNLWELAPGIIAERFVYSASLGYCILLGKGITKIFYSAGSTNSFLKNKFVPLTLAMVIIILYSTETIARNIDWKDTLTLCRTDLKKFENSYNLHFIFVNTLGPQIMPLPESPKRKQLVEEALGHYRKIAEIVESGMNNYPLDYISRNNLGQIYVNYLNKPAEAQSLFRYAMSINPVHAESHFNLGFSYEKLNMPDSAEFYYEKTIDLDSFHIKAYLQLGQILVSKGQFQKAIFFGEKAGRIFPHNAKIQVELGNVYIMNKDTLNAVNHFIKAIALDSENQDLRSQIVNFLKTAGLKEKSDSVELFIQKKTKH